MGHVSILHFFPWLSIIPWHIQSKVCLACMVDAADVCSSLCFQCFGVYTQEGRFWTTWSGPHGLDQWSVMFNFLKDCQPICHSGSPTSHCLQPHTRIPAPLCPHRHSLCASLSLFISLAVYLCVMAILVGMMTDCILGQHFS